MGVCRARPVTAGRNGDSERRILLAMAALYKRGANAQGVFRGSQREWLELAHLTDYHASEKALLRLQQPTTGHPSVLRVCGTDTLSGARLWQIAEMRKQGDYCSADSKWFATYV